MVGRSFKRSGRKASGNAHPVVGSEGIDPIVQPADEPDSGIEGNGIDTASDDNESSSYQFVEPTTAVSDDSGSGDGTGERKRRGRPRGSGTGTGGKARAAKATEATEAVAAILFSMHGMMAAVSKIEELEITEDESEKLAKAAVRLTQLYGLGEMGEKAAAWINLSMAMGQVYGPRILAVSIQNKRKVKVIHAVQS